MGAAVNERQIQAVITRMCDDRGLYWKDEPDSRRSKKGWVDLVILGNGALFVEVKADTGRRTREQIDMSLKLVFAGLQYRLWREEDLRSGVVEDELNKLVNVAV